MSKKHISRRADAVDNVKQQIENLWDDNNGPLENIFGLSSYMVPFVPGLGWAIFLLDQIGNVIFGFGLKSLGKWADQQLGLSPGSNLEFAHLVALGDMLTQKIKDLADQEKTSAHNSEINKFASLSGMLRLVGGIPRITKLLWFAIKSLLLALGVQRVKDIYSGKATSLIPSSSETQSEEEKDSKTDGWDFSQLWENQLKLP